MQDGLEVKFGIPSISDAVTRVVTGAWPKFTIHIQFSTVAAPWKLEVSQTDTIANVKEQIFTKYRLVSALFFLLSI